MEVTDGGLEDAIARVYHKRESVFAELEQLSKRTNAQPHRDKIAKALCRCTDIGTNDAGI